MIYLLLRGVAALFALLLVVSLLSGLIGSRRPWRQWLVLGIVSLLFMAASEAVTPMMPLQHGPYHGGPRTGCESLAGTPGSAVAIGRGRRLEAFEQCPGDPAPTVRLVAGGGVTWCIYATAKDRRVRSLRFDRAHTTLVGGTVVVGRVQWTYGDQAAWWYLDPFGGLRAYFFSS